MIGGSDRSRKLHMTVLVGLIATLLLLTAVSSWGQLAQYVEDVTHPGGLTRLRVAAPTVVTVGENGNYWVRPAGRFQLLTGPASPRGGNPTRPGDESRIICSQEYLSTNDFYAFTSLIQFSIDQTSTEADVEGMEVDIHALMEAAETADSPGGVQNYWPGAMTSGSRDVQGTARIPLGADDGDDDEDGDEVVSAFLEVYHHFTLIHDTLMVELIITNASGVDHLVGTRIVFDAGFGGSTIYDGQPIFLPNGSVVESERVFPDPDDPSVGMPTSWVSYDDVDNPVIALRGLIDGAEVHNPSFANEAAGLPDALEFGTYGRLAASWFDFAASAFAPITNEDWAYAVKWDEKRIAAGRSRRYVTYFGLGAASADYDPPFAVAGYSPYKLIQKAGDDPATPDITEDYYLADEQGRSPFPVALYVDNFSPSDLLSATATIDLPEGLELWPATQARTRSLGLVGRNQLVGVTWTIRASGARPGVAEIKFTGPRGKTVRRKLYIPALPVFIPDPAASGLEMISIPYEFISSNDAEHVFESLGSLTIGGLVALIRWDHSARQYRWFPDPFVSNVLPGQGYWLLNRAGVTVRLPADARAIPFTQTISVGLVRGWNQLGCPFTIPIRFDSLRVIGPFGREWSMAEAVARDLVQPTVFSFNTQTNEYEWETILTQIRLDPYVGYWLLAKDDVTLVFPPPTVLMPTQRHAETVASAEDEGAGWQVEIMVSGAGLRRAGRAFGVSAASGDGLDATDVPSPPVPITEGPDLQVEFVSTQGHQPPCLVDMRSTADSENTWELAVTTNATGQDIVVSWPNLTALPASLRAIIEDTATGERRYMRTTRSYRYNSAGGGQRVFRIRVQARDESGLTVSQVHAAAAGQGKWEICYTLSAPASVQVQVRNISGVIIKRLASGQLAPAGKSTLLWHGLSEQGTPVPAGCYLCEITAASPDTGQVSKAVGTIMVTR